MSDGDAALAEFIARVRRLGTLGADAAKIAAPYVLEAARETAAAGTTPSGEAWAPKKDGGRALVNAADALSVEAVGSVVVLTLTGPEVIHNRGTTKYPKRQILPAGGAGIPANIGKALARAAKEAFDRTMGGGT
jgi:hypothetical protein